MAEQGIEVSKEEKAPTAASQAACCAYGVFLLIHIGASIERCSHKQAQRLSNSLGREGGSCCEHALTFFFFFKLFWIFFVHNNIAEDLEKELGTRSPMCSFSSKQTCDSS